MLLQLFLLWLAALILTSSLSWLVSPWLMALLPVLSSFWQWPVARRAGARAFGEWVRAALLGWVVSALAMLAAFLLLRFNMDYANLIWLTALTGAIVAFYQHLLVFNKRRRRAAWVLTNLLFGALSGVLGTGVAALVRQFTLISLGAAAQAQAAPDQVLFWMGLFVSVAAYTLLNAIQISLA